MSRKQPKPIKGGSPCEKCVPNSICNPNQPGQLQVVPGGQQKQSPRITYLDLIQDNAMYRDKFWKRGQVKTPEGMPVNEDFLSQMEILKTLSLIQVKSTILDKWSTVYGGHETYEECMEVSGDNMVMVLLEALTQATEYSDPEDPYDKGFCNLLKIMVSLYTGNPYCRDRIGWIMWCFARHIYGGCYFPLTLNLYYDPRLWHRPGQEAGEELRIPKSFIINGRGQTWGPEDDIWNCDISDLRPPE